MDEWRRDYRYVPGRGALGQMDIERLIAEAQQGSEDAYEELMRRSKPVVEELVRYYHVRGHDSADLRSIARMHSVGAMRTYRPGGGCAWYQWLHIVLRRRICSEIRASFRHRRCVLWKSAPMEDEDGCGADGRPDPADEASLRVDDRAARALAALHAVCTPLEWRALVLVCFEGLGYRRAAECLGVGRKCVDNALARVRRKATALGLRELGGE